jgi:nucleotide-binding universal stress UspA family protein
MDIFIQDEMEKLLAPLRNGVSLRRVIAKGKPAEEICALAEKELVDLVAMRSSRAVVTNKVIRTTTRPVLAIPTAPEGHGAGERVGEARRIVIATDFSEHALKVARYAFELPMAADAQIFLIHVIEMTQAIEFAIEQSHYRDTMPKMKEWAMNQLMNAIPDRLVGSPRVMRIVESGVASDRIAAIAASVGADLVVLGAHEHGLAHRFLLGTTTDRLLTSISTPVLTLRL